MGDPAESSEARARPLARPVHEQDANRSGDDGRLQVDDGAAPTSLDVSDHLDAEHRGPVVELAGVDSLERAGETDLAFCVYDSAAHLGETDAGAVICPPEFDGFEGQTQIRTADPRLGFVLAAQAFFTDEPHEQGTSIHPSATVHDDAEIADGVRIGPNVYVGKAVHIGEGCTVRAGSVIGCAGFGFARDEDDKLHRMPHNGTVRLERDVEIGPNCSIDRAVFAETVIGARTKLSGHVHVAHQVRIGRDTTVAFGAGFGGGATVGHRVTVHPEVSVGEGVEIGDDAEVGMNSTVLADVPSGTTVVGSPARPVDRGEDGNGPDEDA